MVNSTHEIVNHFPSMCVFHVDVRLQWQIGITFVVIVGHCDNSFLHIYRNSKYCYTATYRNPYGPASK